MYKGIQKLEDLPELLIAQIKHFFEHYKDLEPGKWVKVVGWDGIEAAKAEVTGGLAAYARITPDLENIQPSLVSALCWPQAVQ